MVSVSLLSAAARRLEGKVALITGGVNGIDECTARLLSKHKAKLVIADINNDSGHSVCKDLTDSTSSSSSASYVHSDVTNKKDVENAVNTATSKYGKLDIMLNNAGIIEAWRPSIVKSARASDQRELGRHLSRNEACGEGNDPHAQRLHVSMASGSGSIEGMTSHAYTYSKHGVIGLTKNATVELGKNGICVNMKSRRNVI